MRMTSLAIRLLRRVNKRPLDVLRLSTGLDHVTARILSNVVYSVVKRNEFAIRNNIYTGLLEFFLPERAIVLQTIGIRRSTDYFFTLLAKRLCFFALAQGVVENEDVRPIDIFFPVFGFGDKAVANVALFFITDEVANFMSFLGNLPGDVADESS